MPLSKWPETLESQGKHARIMPSGALHLGNPGFDKLMASIVILKEVGIKGEIWVDGSLLTEKIDPGDADVVLRLEGEFVDNASDEQRAALDAFVDDDSPLVDAYAFAYWPEGHQHHSYGKDQEAYWLRLWGFSRKGDIKGIAVIELDGNQND